MITKYFTSVSVKFNPFSQGAKTARLFLSRIPPSMKSTCKINYQVLDSKSKSTPLIEVTYKDKHKQNLDPESVTFKELTDKLDEHSRKLALQDAISE
ncbi:Piso0_002933 [Millerozyma farinosa CBS 7064]|uniref:Large ribosomal subunit protein mL53 n=1 Tax=Pichia sorbitophila (strain ATCC MYA-4447 / BCRC 22081 / CBS 7064 / NBRC 10061 / NRRL Y-12695) TaxID=559304 RepID=G8YGQ5_PICSO|nr:Piso0_002933 [Millerozyma farinosa CBS 7064]CCE80607.1 Piso0_002933 [Millerozyma farinosa CBS 7064]